ncbi:hypothetical protein [Sphingomonas sp. G-3-2-10]|uniref:hypothetical protein n=1 Tax=Sphingomonas sp. G-3-2-10 TaxID=2728838 RepID=UPI00146E9815|nr:hypothetical protein [Sphingomonas sp. G-3-2-10]NML05064.1 hypothetical protein [Sphingomonas sp. G-3-2-10]
MIATLAALVLAVAPQGAPAPSAADTAKLVKGMHGFSACVAKDRANSNRLLGTMPGSAEEATVLVELMSEGCPKFGDLTIEPALLRGTMAEALFERDFSAIGGKPKNPVAALFAIPAMDAFNQLAPISKLKVAFLGFAQCVVAAAPKETVNLLRTEPGSASERTAFAAVAPALGPCLNDGMKIEFNRTQLRGALAEAAYRASVQARAGETK